MDYTEEYRTLIEAYSKAGGNRSALSNGKAASLVVHENRVLSVNQAQGITLKSKAGKNGITAELVVMKDKKIELPVHLCFGFLPKEGLQEIVLRVQVHDGGEVNVVAHCIFPNAVKVVHKMDAEIEIGRSARFGYQETHYHGDSGGIEVIPKAKITVHDRGVYQNTFALIEGCVGKLDFDYEVVCCGENSVAELMTKVYGKRNDEIKISEKVRLDGRAARSLVKSRLVLKDSAKAEVVNETYGNAPLARGHIDCIEIVNGEDVVARAIPIASVTNDQAKVTHEAAIGSIDKKQLETLMARGLEQSEAVDTIVKGILR